MLWLAVLAACEKTGPVEESGGGSSSPREPQVTTAPAPAKVATLPADAGVVVAVDAVAKAASDANKQAPDDEVIANALVMVGPSSGTDEGDMSVRRPGSDLQKQIDDVRVGTGRGPSIGSPPPTASGGKDDRVASGPSGRIVVASKQSFDDSSLTADTVLAKIQAAYMAGIKRCYKNYLKKDASARGKLVLQLTVNETGRSVNGKASGFASEIDDCVAGMTGGWRFPIPKDKDGEKTQASFAFNLQLVPD